MLSVVSTQGKGRTELYTEISLARMVAFNQVQNFHSKGTAIINAVKEAKKHLQPLHELRRDAERKIHTATNRTQIDAAVGAFHAFVSCLAYRHPLPAVDQKR